MMTETLLEQECRKLAELALSAEIVPDITRRDIDRLAGRIRTEIEDYLGMLAEAQRPLPTEQEDEPF